MSKRTRVILLCAVIVLIGMCVFPPQAVRFNGIIVRHGYFFINKDWSEESNKLQTGVLSSQIEYDKLGFQAFVICLSTLALLLILGFIRLGHRSKGSYE